MSRLGTEETKPNTTKASNAGRTFYANTKTQNGNLNEGTNNGIET